MVNFGMPFVAYYEQRAQRDDVYQEIVRTLKDETSMVEKLAWAVEQAAVAYCEDDRQALQMFAMELQSLLSLEQEGH
jgi:hypothetical protein